MEELKSIFQNKAKEIGNDLKNILKNHGDLQVDSVTLKQVIGGMRGIKCMFAETSHLDPIEGIKFRGFSIPELQEKLPRSNGEEPLPEGLFWLMLTGELPTKEQVTALAEDWRSRSKVPAHTFATIDALPLETHPMTQFNIAIASMQTESIFAAKYAEGISSMDYWDPTYVDTMNLIAGLPQVAGSIYRR